MATYNGHKNWNHWNVSLWINNDEGLYQLARMAARDQISRSAAAYYMLDCLNRQGITQTPDGAPYSVSSIRAAMVGM
jgi:hypothetical protein